MKQQQRAGAALAGEYGGAEASTRDRRGKIVVKRGSRKDPQVSPLVSLRGGALSAGRTGEEQMAPFLLLRRKAEAEEELDRLPFFREGFRADEHVDDSFDALDPALVEAYSARRPRRILVQSLAFLSLLGALGAVVWMGRSNKAVREAIVSWATLGHGDEAAIERVLTR